MFMKRSGFFLILASRPPGVAPVHCCLSDWAEANSVQGINLHIWITQTCKQTRLTFDWVVVTLQDVPTVLDLFSATWLKGCGSTMFDACSCTAGGDSSYSVSWFGGGNSTNAFSVGKSTYIYSHDINYVPSNLVHLWTLDSMIYWNN